MRSFDEINQDYCELCLQLGDKSFQLKKLVQEIELLQTRISRIDQEGIEWKLANPTVKPEPAEEDLPEIVPPKNSAAVKRAMAIAKAKALEKRHAAKQKAKKLRK